MRIAIAGVELVLTLEIPGPSAMLCILERRSDHSVGRHNNGECTC